ncbi:MAG TPA: M24 family metallopeptidase [Candidatus Brocadiia bacterium]|nr:M24 family metallopeptidase [Candidatus Brocadiia bacterium]
MDRKEEFRLKSAILTEYMKERSLSGIFVARPANVAWLGCGACNVVNVTGATGVATLGFVDGELHLIAKNIEVRRMLEEELDGIASIRTHTASWHEFGKGETFIRRLLAGGRGASDCGLDATAALDAKFDELRYSLTDAEMDRCRIVGRDLRDAMETACRAVRPGMRECDAAAALFAECRRRMLEPVVALAAADERIGMYRHPTISEKKIKKCLLMATCARRWGLTCAITRIAHFGTLPQELVDKHRACLSVDATLIANSRPDAAFGEVLRKGIEAYAAAGFADEWNLHHQGGPTGYEAREFIVAPGEIRKVRQRQPIAWNPSITGTKSEDTIVATGGGQEIVTGGGDWPTIEVEAEGMKFQRPDILTLPA